MKYLAVWGRFNHCVGYAIAQAGGAHDEGAKFTADRHPFALPACARGALGRILPF